MNYISFAHNPLKQEDFGDGKGESKRDKEPVTSEGHTRRRKTEKQKQRGEKRKSLVISSALPLSSVRLNKTKTQINHANAVTKEQKYSGRTKNMRLAPWKKKSFWKILKKSKTQDNSKKSSNV